MPRSGLQRVARVVKQRAEDRHTNCTDRNQSVLDFSARKITGRKTSHADADSNSRLQQADMRFIHMQHVVPINHDRELQERCEKPQVGVAHHSPAENAIGADNLEVRKKIAKRIPAKKLRRISRWHSRDCKTRSQPDERASQKNHARHFWPSAIMRRQESSGHHSRNAAKKCSKLDDSVSPGKFLLRQ